MGWNRRENKLAHLAYSQLNPPNPLPEGYGAPSTSGRGTIRIGTDCLLPPVRCLLCKNGLGL